MIKNLVYLLMASTLVIASCSTHHANLDMSEFKSQMPVKSGALEGQDLGYVVANEGGFIWSECTEQARISVHRLIETSKAKGANAIGNVKWAARETSEPSCKKGWGWFMLPVFVFTPLFMNTKVEGTAYKVNEAAPGKKTGLLMLPNNEAEEAAFIETVLTL